LHATILWRLGLDQVNVTYLHNGPSERPTIVSGEVIRDVLAWASTDALRDFLGDQSLAAMVSIHPYDRVNRHGRVQR